MSASNEKSMIYISNNVAEGIREEHSNGTANCNEYNYNVEINDIFVTSERARENVMMHKAYSVYPLLLRFSSGTEKSVLFVRLCRASFYSIIYNLSMARERKASYRLYGQVELDTKKRYDDTKFFQKRTFSGVILRRTVKFSLSDSVSPFNPKPDRLKYHIPQQFAKCHDIDLVCNRRG